MVVGRGHLDNSLEREVSVSAARRRVDGQRARLRLLPVVCLQEVPDAASRRRPGVPAAEGLLHLRLEAIRLRQSLARGGEGADERQAAGRTAYRRRHIRQRGRRRRAGDESGEAGRSRDAAAVRGDIDAPVSTREEQRRHG